MENNDQNTAEISDINFIEADKHIQLGYSDFLSIALPVDGHVGLRDFGSWLNIEKDGLYASCDTEIIATLTPEEAAIYCIHPTGNLLEPVLKFPFNVAELEQLLIFANKHGLDAPLSREAYERVVASKRKPEASNTLEDKNRYRAKTLIQEEAITSELLNLGYDPKNLPPRKQGCRGIKFEVRSKLETRKDLFTKTSFNKAWDRLRAKGEINEAN